MVSHYYSLIKLKEIPFKVCGSIGTLHLLAKLFVLLFSSNFVIDFVNRSVLQNKGYL